MPELPELQAHAERLSRDFGGLELAGFRAIAFTALKTYAPAPEQAVGHRARRPSAGGASTCCVDFGAAVFVVHLMQGGRLKPDDKQSPKPRGGLARWMFHPPAGWAGATPPALLLTEAGTEKRAGVWVREGELAELEQQEPLARPRSRCRHARRHRAGVHLRRALDAAPRDAPRPARPGRHRPAAGQRGLPPGQAVAVRQRVEADAPTRSSGWPPPSRAASTSRSPTSAGATT